MKLLTIAILSMLSVQCSPSLEAKVWLERSPAQEYERVLGMFKAAGFKNPADIKTILSTDPSKVPPSILDALAGLKPNPVNALTDPATIKSVQAYLTVRNILPELSLLEKSYRSLEVILGSIKASEPLRTTLNMATSYYGFRRGTSARPTLPLLVAFLLEAREGKLQVDSFFLQLSAQELSTVSLVADTYRKLFDGYLSGPYISPKRIAQRLDDLQSILSTPTTTSEDPSALAVKEKFRLLQAYRSSFQGQFEEIKKILGLPDQVSFRAFSKEMRTLMSVLAEASAQHPLNKAKADQSKAAAVNQLKTTDGNTSGKTDPAVVGAKTQADGKIQPGVQADGKIQQGVQVDGKISGKTDAAKTGDSTKSGSVNSSSNNGTTNAATADSAKTVLEKSAQAVSGQTSTGAQSTNPLTSTISPPAQTIQQTSSKVASPSDISQGCPGTVDLAAKIARMRARLADLQKNLDLLNVSAKELSLQLDTF